MIKAISGYFAALAIVALWVAPGYALAFVPVKLAAGIVLAGTVPVAMYFFARYRAERREILEKAIFGLRVFIVRTAATGGEVGIAQAELLHGLYSRVSRDFPKEYREMLLGTVALFRASATDEAKKRVAGILEEIR